MQLANITIDAAEPLRLARFWAEATGRRLGESSAEFAFLVSETEPWRMLFLKVPEGKVAKNRLHLDFHSHDRAAEVSRLVALGATQHATHDEYGIVWTVMSDPEGNEFCVAQA